MQQINNRITIIEILLLLNRSLIMIKLNLLIEGGCSTIIDKMILFINFICYSWVFFQLILRHLNYQNYTSIPFRQLFYSRQGLQLRYELTTIYLYTCYCMITEIKWCRFWSVPRSYQLHWNTRYCKLSYTGGAIDKRSE